MHVTHFQFYRRSTNRLCRRGSSKIIFQVIRMNYCPQRYNNVTHEFPIFDRKFHDFVIFYCECFRSFFFFFFWTMKLNGNKKIELYRKIESVLKNYFKIVQKILCNSTSITNWDSLENRNRNYSNNEAYIYLLIL